MLEILFQDDHFVAINKPHGLLVHSSSIARDATEFAIQKLRDQINHKVFPVHRLDRKTSGVLLFALSAEVNSLMQQKFMNHEVGKKYLAIVRGYTKDEDRIEYELQREDGKIQEAITNFKTLQTSEIDIPSNGFKTSRYSLIEVYPETGRFHQIRKHMAHIRHPIIGDRPHGCNKQNKIFLEQFNMNSMMLHASHLDFYHPITEESIKISANPLSEFERMLVTLNFKKID